MNRVGLGLAIGAGYLLGRTKKMKLAFAVGSMVAGKRLNLTPRALADLVSQQLKDNPQFKQLGDELRQDLRGVGKAASGAMVERQMNALADRLHSRTGQVRDQLQGVVPDMPGGGSREDEDTDEEYDEPESARDERDEDEDAEDEAEDNGTAENGAEDGEAAEEETQERPRKKTAAKKAPAKKAAKKAPARKAPVKKTAASGRETAARTASRARRPKEGGE
ncbi:DNA primase [Streptomyces sp. NPDC006259]|uniref:DNA primase n=1 Tax=Streptomyces sp. NPDC006259 TaxID=3364740 RepID=UPI0036B78F7E